MIDTTHLATPADSRREAVQLAGELLAARRVALRASRKATSALKGAKERPGDVVRTARARRALERWLGAQARVAKLEAEVPVPTRFYLLGLAPFGPAVGVPGWYGDARKLLPWWVRWAVRARRVR